ncbi:hypothetical protein MPSD_36190 [Mycobacterium pseudoshottsii JCM 15466]|uniref:Uncharacterized protein n=2 Tax=Mycobacterium ulcerans group TaxID=2993898 RepID=A0A9N7LWT8_9MYCO|nr:hypothetical protein MPSD_36190 [Mycobacterium pseudoshottsii JCM 15466]BDN83339.1 hypothetical protein NJB1907Z4_C35540 [Mycobacterium pseudoshottsii]
MFAAADELAAPETRLVNEIDRWFQRRARREGRLVSLYTSLLTGRIFAYFRYRLRSAFLLDTSRFAVHVIEFLLLLSSLGGLAVFTVMVLRIGSLIAGGGWWGLLEVMRERLRGFFRAGDRDAAEREIGSWLVLSVIVAVVLMIGAGAALTLLRPSGDDSIAHLYALLVVLELALGFPVRVIHSGIYATRRIYRPRWLMLAPTFVQLGILTAGLYWYPTAAIIIAIVASNAIGIWGTVHFTLEVYRLTGLWPKLGAPWYAFWRLLPKIPPWLGLQTTLSGLVLRMDAIIVLAIVGVYGTSTRSFDLTAGVAAWRHVDVFQFFYLVLPLFCGAFEGAGLFYFDFVRLRSIPALREFRLFFFHRLLMMTPLIALFFWSLAAVLGTYVLHDIPLSFLFALLPLFVVRSLIGMYQIRLFAEGRFGTHLLTIVLLAGLLWLVWMDRNPASDLIQITAALIAQLVVLIDLQHYRDRRPPAPPTLLMLGDWMRALAREQGPVLVGSITIPDSIAAKQRSAAVALMRQTFSGKGHFAFRSATILVYYQRTANGDTAQQPHLALQAITGGAANRGNSLGMPMTTGAAALDRLIAEKWILPMDDVTSQSGDVETLCAEFHVLFPDGIVFDLDTFAGARDMRNLDHGVLTAALPAAIASLEGGSIVVPLADRLLTPLYHDGRLRRLMLLPPDPEPAVFRRWLQTMKAWRFSWGTMETGLGRHG